MRNAVHHSGDFIGGHARPDGQRDHARVFMLGYREITQAVPELLLVNGVQMERYEMHAGANSEMAERGDELISGARQAFKMQPNNVQMPAIIGAAAPVRNLDLRKGRQSRVEHLRNRSAFLPELIHSSQL